MTEGTTKQCWSCETRTPYEIGWCEECQKLIPQDINLALTFAVTEPIAGEIRGAVAGWIKKMRRKKINLNDLDIGI